MTEATPNQNRWGDIFSNEQNQAEEMSYAQAEILNSVAALSDNVRLVRDDIAKKTSVELTPAGGQYLLVLPVPTHTKDMVEAINRLREVSHLPPKTPKLVENAHMLVAGATLIQEQVVPILDNELPQQAKDAHDLSQAMSNYGQKVLADLGEPAPPQDPSQEKTVEWLIGPQVYGRLYRRFQQTHPQPANPQEFTKWLLNKKGFIAKAFTQELGLKTETGIHQVAHAGRHELAATLHQRGMAEMANIQPYDAKAQLQALKWKADHIPGLTRSERLKSAMLEVVTKIPFMDDQTQNTLKEKIGYQAECEKLQSLRTTGSATAVARCEAELADKLYREIKKFPHSDQDFAAVPRQILSSMHLNCMGKTKLLGALLQEAGCKVFGVTCPKHMFLLMEFADGQYSTYDANGWGVEKNVETLKPYGVSQGLQSSDYLPLALSDKLKSRYSRISTGFSKDQFRILPFNEAAEKDILSKVGTNISVNYKDDPYKPAYTNDMLTDVYERTLAIDPGDIRTRDDLIGYLSTIGDYAKAQVLAKERSKYAAAQDYEPDVVTLPLRAEIESRIKKGELEQAFDATKRLIERGNNSQAIYLLHIMKKASTDQYYDQPEKFEALSRALIEAAQGEAEHKRIAAPLIIEPQLVLLYCRHIPKPQAQAYIQNWEADFQQRSEQIIGALKAEEDKADLRAIIQKHMYNIKEWLKESHEPKPI